MSEYVPVCCRPGRFNGVFFFFLMAWAYKRPSNSMLRNRDRYILRMDNLAVMFNFGNTKHSSHTPYEIAYEFERSQGFLNISLAHLTIKNLRVTRLEKEPWIRHRYYNCSECDDFDSVNKSEWFDFFDHLRYVRSG